MKHAGSMANVDQYSEEIISLCGDSFETIEGSLQLLRSVCMSVCVCVRVSNHDHNHAHT